MSLQFRLIGLLGMLGPSRLDNTFIDVYENALAEDTCNLIIGEFNQMWDASAKMINITDEETNENNVREVNDLKYRTDQSLFAEAYSPKTYVAISRAVEKCMVQYVEKYSALKSYGGLVSTTAKIQRTPIQGGFHTWHFESTPKQNCDRAGVWTLYLNTLPEGEAETEFLYQGIKVRPQAGTVLLAPTSWTHLHRGNPPYTCEKYIATGWFTLNN